MRVEIESFLPFLRLRKITGYFLIGKNVFQFSLKYMSFSLLLRRLIDFRWVPWSNRFTAVWGILAKSNIIVFRSENLSRSFLRLFHRRTKAFAHTVLPIRTYRFCINRFSSWSLSLCSCRSYSPFQTGAHTLTASTEQPVHLVDYCLITFMPNFMRKKLGVQLYLILWVAKIWRVDFLYHLFPLCVEKDLF